MSKIPLPASAGSRKPAIKSSKTVKPSTSSRQVVPKSAANVVQKNPFTGMKAQDLTYTAVQLTPEQLQQLRLHEMIEGVNTVLGPEADAAVEAIETGIYIGWRVPGHDYDCQRVGSKSKCFCGHDLMNHKGYSVKSVNVPCAECRCKRFRFIPHTPEQVGEHWLKKRPNGDDLVAAWKAKCRCMHNHDSHDPNHMRCLERGCGCLNFNSNFLCAACDKHWEEHETLFESESDRIQLGLPCGESYIPLAELPRLQKVIRGKLQKRTSLTRPERPAITFDPNGS